MTALEHNEILSDSQKSQIENKKGTFLRNVNFQFLYQYLMSQRCSRWSSTFWQNEIKKDCIYIVRPHKDPQNQELLNLTSQLKSAEQEIYASLSNLEKGVKFYFQLIKGQLKYNNIYHPLLLRSYKSIEWIERIVYQKNQQKDPKLKQRNLINVTKMIGKIFMDNNLDELLIKQNIQIFQKLQLQIRPRIHYLSKKILNQIIEIMKKSRCRPNNKVEDLTCVYNFYQEFVDNQHHFQIVLILKQALQQQHLKKELKTAQLIDLLNDYERQNSRKQEKVYWIDFEERVMRFFDLHKSCLRKKEESLISDRSSMSNMEGQDNSFSSFVQNSKYILKFSQQIIYDKNITRIFVEEQNTKTICLFSTQAQEISTELQNFSKRMEMDIYIKLAEIESSYIIKPIIEKKVGQFWNMGFFGDPVFRYSIPQGILPFSQKNWLTAQRIKQCITCFVNSCIKFEEIGLYYADYRLENIIYLQGLGFRIIDFDYAYPMNQNNQNLRNIVKILLLYTSNIKKENKYSCIISKLYTDGESENQYDHYKSEFKKKFQELRQNNKESTKLKELINKYVDKCLELIRSIFKISHMRQIIHIVDTIISCLNISNKFEADELRNLKEALYQLKRNCDHPQTRIYNKFLDKINKYVPKANDPPIILQNPERMNTKAEQRPDRLVHKANLIQSLLNNKQNKDNIQLRKAGERIQQQMDSILHKFSRNSQK